MPKRASRPGSAGGVLRVAETRAHILNMITRLKRNDSAPLRRVDPSPSRKPLRNGHGPESSAPTRPHTTEAASFTGLMLAMHRMESRLLQIENALGQRHHEAGMSGRALPFKDATFSGLIQGQMLSDMLQIVSSNSMSGIFVIENEITSCTLYFDEGRICHAASGEVTGEEAFFTAFALPSGRYHFKEMAQLPPERTISAGTQFLVLEALRRMDEKNA